MSIEWLGPLPQSNYAPGRQGMQIAYLALHHSEASMESMDAHFHNPSAQVSAHYGVAHDGRVWQWVNNADTAFSVGNFSGNLESISLEHEETGDDAFTDLQYATSAALIRSLCLAFNLPIQRGAWPGISGLVPHREFSATACPGTLDIDRLIRLAQEVAVASPTLFSQSSDLQLVVGEVGQVAAYFTYPADPGNPRVVGPFKVVKYTTGRTIFEVYPPVDPDADPTIDLSAVPATFVIDVRAA